MNWGTTPVLGDHGILHSGRWLWLRSIGWIIVLIFAVMLPFGLGGEAIAHALPHEPVFQFLAKVAGAFIVILAYTAFVRLGERRWPSELALSAAPLGILSGLSVGVIMFAAVMTILVGTGAYSFSYIGAAPAWHGIGLAIESGVIEEILIRGVVMRLAWRALGPGAGIAVSAFLFGVGHIGNPGATVFTTACVAPEAGLMLGSFYVLTGRLWVSIGVHAGWNFTQGYLFGANVSGSDFGVAISRSTPAKGIADWLTGASFGPEASLPSLAVCTIVGAMVLWLAWRSQLALQGPDFSLSVTPPTSQAIT
jgi:membrane protease YdiL (CAAX protease family)